jgi:porphobilinogen deaminase
LDGIVTAGCALLRLGLKRRTTQTIPFEIIEPHPMQGALAIVTRKEDANLIELLSILDSRERLLI